MSILGRSEKSYKTKQHQTLVKFGAVILSTSLPYQVALC